MEHTSEVFTLQPHAMCLVGEPGLLWAIVVADLTYFVSYMLIPLGLQILRAPILAFDSRAAQVVLGIDSGGVAAIRKHMVLAFQLFITACGLTHLWNAITMFFALYIWATTFHVVGAVISITIAAAIILGGLRLRKQAV